MNPELKESLTDALKYAKSTYILKSQLEKSNIALESLVSKHRGEVAIIIEDLIKENEKIIRENSWK